MKLRDAAADYVQYLRHEQRATPTTVRTYQAGLNAFLRWLIVNGHPDASTFDFNTPTLRRYLYALSERSLRPRTLRGRFHPLKGLATFLMAHGGLKADPTAGITLPKLDPAQRLTVSEEEVRQLLDGCERLADERKTALVRGVLNVLLFGGLRRQELLDLTVEDFDPAERRLHIRHGKGDKARFVYLPDMAVQAVSAWLALRPASSVRSLFLWDRSKAIGQDALAALIEEVKAAAGLRGKSNIKPHSLRHFYASHLMRNGADLESIRQLLGHSDLRTTSIYIHADARRLKDVAQLAALAFEPAKPPESSEQRVAVTQADKSGQRLRRVASR